MAPERHWMGPEIDCAAVNVTLNRPLTTSHSSTLPMSFSDDPVDQIMEILAGATAERPPALEEFFKAMGQKMTEVDEDGDELGFEGAWNEVVFNDEGEGTKLGDAIADFRDGELTERLGFEPDSEDLDDALEQWITMHFMG